MVLYENDAERSFSTSSLDLPHDVTPAFSGRSQSGLRSGTHTSFPTLYNYSTNPFYQLATSRFRGLFLCHLPPPSPSLATLALDSELSPHGLVQRLCKVPDVVAVQPRHRDSPVLRQVDVRLLHQRLALRRANPRETAQKRQQSGSRHSSATTHVLPRLRPPQPPSVHSAPLRPTTPGTTHGTACHPSHHHVLTHSSS